MILNLTQHTATADQVSAGVVDLQGDALLALLEALTFEYLPSNVEIRDRADWIAELAKEAGCKEAMIGGALWLMAPLIKELCFRGIKPLFSFSARKTSETILPDGTTRKKSFFAHMGFIPAIL